jgi:hypothetical protein
LESNAALSILESNAALPSLESNAALPRYTKAKYIGTRARLCRNVISFLQIISRTFRCNVEEILVTKFMEENLLRSSRH